MKVSRASARLPASVRRPQIVAAALAIVARDGVAGLSVASVARGCRLVPSALYRHFGGRGEILEALVATLGERLRANLRSAESSSPRTLPRLRHLYDRHLAMGGGSAALPRLVFSEEVSAAASPLRGALHRALTAYLAGIAAIVRRGRRRGEIRGDAEPRAVAGLFLGAVQHTVVLAHAGGSAFPREAHATRVWAELTRSLAPRRRGSRTPRRRAADRRPPTP